MHWYLIIKYIGSVIAALYGVYATINDFHEEKDGQKVLSPKAYYGIALLLAASLLALSSDFFKDRSDIKSAAEDATNRADITEKMRTQLNQTQAIGQTLQQSLTQQNASFGSLTSKMQTQLLATEKIRSGLDQSLDRQNETLRGQQRLATKEQLLQLQVIRPYYPLEPLSISYQVEFPMDDPAYQPYVQRLRRDIVKDWNDHRRFGEITLSAPEDIKAQLNLSNTQYTWMPGTVPGEDSSARAILGWGVEFFLKAKNDPDHKKIEFMCISPSYAPAIRSLSKGTPVFDVTLLGDFQRHVFTEIVRCENPIRNGEDSSSFSVLDLVGLDMTWSPYPGNATLTRFGFRFPKDFDDQDQQVQTPIPAGVRDIEITPKHVGLESLYKQLGFQ